MEQKIASLLPRIEGFLNLHRVNGAAKGDEPAPLAGQFSLHRRAGHPDLYGMLDAAYSLFTLGQLPAKTNRDSRAEWAGRILACQDEFGWFSRDNLRGHSPEHATAYAIGALRLLEVAADEDYVGKVKPLVEVLPLLEDPERLLKWLRVLDFRLSPSSVLRKKAGWHYVWRGSHVGGGIPAALGMLPGQIESWWPAKADMRQWFSSYFAWLDAHAQPKTGYWQRAFWNVAYRKPTIGDMGGATHFFWVYEGMGRPFPHARAVIQSTLSLQRASGLYRDHPFCIDLDGNFCLIRSYLQLPEEQKLLERERVYSAAERNFEGIVDALLTRPLEDIYADSHGLPGALAALIECTKLPDFRYSEAISGWRHPLDQVMWL